MLNFQQYANSLNNISPRIGGLANYGSYFQFENDWIDYYNNIFQHNFHPNLQIRLIVCESCPNGNYPNANYIFDANCLANIVNCKRDKYLQQIYNGVFPRVAINHLPTKMQALVDLSQENILILDLLPTHGITLSTNDRINININPIGCCDINKILQLPNIQNLDFNYVFAVPPTLYAINFLINHLPQNFVEWGNLNIGQGHCPSRNALNAIINMGF